MLFGDEHVRRYRETDGAEGYIWRNGTTILILSTTGRKSGITRDNPLIYREWNDAYLIVASRGGSDSAPGWYLNLRADPHVQVQIKGEKFAATARTATPEEKPELWKMMTEVWPDYDKYQEKTQREIPVVVLERV
jgi:deazaflavin-dependent oxidoreductase (nitroreductase family)